MSAEIAAVLRRAAELIDTPEKWCQGHYRMPVGSLHPTARCASAAIGAAANEAGISWISAERPLCRLLKWRLIEPWNDSRKRTHAEVRAALLAAADAEECADG